MNAQTIQKQIHIYLKSINCFSYTTVISARRGIPDIIACDKKGRFIAIEVKYKNDKLSEIQKITLDKFKKLNAIVIVATCLDDVKIAMQEYL